MVTNNVKPTVSPSKRFCLHMVKQLGWETLM